MTSAAKLAANRSNSAKSTGPKTSTGKAVSSKNSGKHGVWAAVSNDEVLNVVSRHKDLFAFIGEDAEARLILAQAIIRHERANLAAFDFIGSEVATTLAGAGAFGRYQVLEATVRRTGARLDRLLKKMRNEAT